MNDIDYGFTKVFNMMVQNQGEYPRYSPDSKYVDVITLSSGLTDGTRDNHTLTGETNPSPSRELLIRISTISRNPSGSVYYPTTVKIGVTVDEVQDVNLDYLDNDFYDQFMWFNMIPIDDHIFGIYLNDIFATYMKNGVKNTIRFIYRAFDNQGNEYKYHNPHYLDNTKHSYWSIDAYKVSLSRYMLPTNVDLLLDGYNAYIGKCDMETCRTIGCDINQNTVTFRDITPLGKTEEDSETKWTRSNNRYVLSQFEMVNIVCYLGTYWMENFDSCTIRIYITDPEGTRHVFFVKPSNYIPGEFNFNFRVCDLSAIKKFLVGNTNRYVNIQFGITPKRHGAEEPETVLSNSQLQLTMLETPDDEFSPEDLGVFFSRTANY